ncbi:phosphoglycerate dehydrogenase-like enzyme [Rhodoligotrophos appendicifer]|uniref:NAD(P)-dependent oxidoreductase n=1 Tax=Rhodoligotrophos appendicifer TaxID=987056 RepID=UPI001186ED4C|nr:NAD(P)-dependent oxidoreductase [Rhodoligotrophos appendicifer]
MSVPHGDERFVVALSGDFLNDAGEFAYPDFDLSPLSGDPRIAIRFLPMRNRIESADLEGVDALIVDDPLVTAESLPDGDRLALVARFGVGFDSVDVDALTRRSIALVNTPDGVRRPVATSIIALILALTLKLLEKDRLARRGARGFAEKGSFVGTGLVGKTLGSIGLGNIGSEMFRLLKPFDLRMIAHDPYASTEQAAALGVDLLDFDDVLGQADILVINCPLNAATEKLINRRAIGLMKPTALLINTARGRIVDQVALTEALQQGAIAGAGLDVFAQEPPADDDPILKLDNVVLSPHALCWTNECIAGNGAADVRAVLEALGGRLPSSIVNRSVVDDPQWRLKLQRNAERFGAGADEPKSVDL